MKIPFCWLTLFFLTKCIAINQLFPLTALPSSVGGGEWLDLLSYFFAYLFVEVRVHIPSFLPPALQGGGQDSTQHSQQFLDYGTAYRHVVADLPRRVNALYLSIYLSIRKGTVLYLKYIVLPLPLWRMLCSSHRMFGFHFQISQPLYHTPILRLHLIFEGFDDSCISDRCFIFQRRFIARFFLCQTTSRPHQKPDTSFV